jgi:hypothetical protein
MNCNQWFIPCIHTYGSVKTTLKQVGKFRTRDKARAFLKLNHYGKYMNCEWSILTEPRTAQ